MVQHGATKSKSQHSTVDLMDAVRKHQKNCLAMLVFMVVSFMCTVRIMPFAMTCNQPSGRCSCRVV